MYITNIMINLINLQITQANKNKCDSDKIIIKAYVQ